MFKWKCAGVSHVPSSGCCCEGGCVWPDAGLGPSRVGAELPPANSLQAGGLNRASASFKCARVADSGPPAEPPAERAPLKTQVP